MASGGDELNTVYEADCGFEEFLPAQLPALGTWTTIRQLDEERNVYLIYVNLSLPLLPII